MSRDIKFAAKTIQIYLFVPATPPPRHVPVQLLNPPFSSRFSSFFRYAPNFVRNHRENIGRDL